MAIIFKESEETYFFCPDCADQIGQCSTCSLGDKCDFQTNPSPIPLKIRRQVQHGPMISVTEEDNPARIAITCKVNCECFDPEKECLKKSGVCNKWRVKK